ncbi:MAG: tyrosine transporter, partial [Simkaniaceae bacterium]|nr:tyrosine transporter [Simkaniaceae bacterium]
FLTYILWEFLILGIIPAEGAHGLLAAKAEGLTAVEPLRYVLVDSSIYAIGQFFGAFALTTSFLGVTLGLFDFLADGLQMQKVGFKKVFLCLLIYVPPVLIAIINPNIFLRALGFAGGIGCALLLGLFPVLMVWVGRYYKNYPSVHRQLPGGKVMLRILVLFVVFELIIEGINEYMSM